MKMERLKDFDKEMTFLMKNSRSDPEYNEAIQNLLIESVRFILADLDRINPTT